MRNIVVITYSNMVTEKLFNLNFGVNMSKKHGGAVG